MITAWFRSQSITTKRRTKYFWIPIDPIDPIDPVGSAVLSPRKNQPSYANLHKHYGRNK